jgi:tight adherence protein C
LPERPEGRCAQMGTVPFFPTASLFSEKKPVIFASSLISFQSVVPLALFGTFAALAWWVLDLIAAGKPRTLERLDELKNPYKRRTTGKESALRKPDAVTKLLEKAGPTLARPLQPKNEAELGKLRTKLATAGFRAEAAGSVFLGLKFVGLVIGLFVGGGAITSLRGVSQSSLTWSVGVAGAFFYLPDLVVRLLGGHRKQAIFLALPDALDMMVVCVEAGLGLDQAMRKVAEEMKKTYRVLAEEFSLSNFQLQMGRPRAEVLHELGSRSGVSDLRALAAVLIQADKFGSSVAQALRTQSDSMRIRRRHLAEEKAAKTAVKLIFPLVLFIFPGIFVILVGPAAITIMNQMMTVMGGG